MSIRDYVRLAAGDTGEEKALSDSELNDIIVAAVLSPHSVKMSRVVERTCGEVKFLNRIGWVELMLSPFNSEKTKFGCGIGGFLDYATDVFVGDESYAPGEGDELNYVTGVLTFAEPMEAKVSVRTYLVDTGKAIHDALMTIAGSEARLAIRMGIAGNTLDMTLLAGELRKQAKEAIGGYDASLPCAMDFPH